VANVHRNGCADDVVCSNRESEQFDLLQSHVSWIQTSESKRLQSHGLCVSETLEKHRLDWLQMRLILFCSPFDDHVLLFQ